MVAFSTSQGEEEQVLNKGWHLVRPRNPVLRYLKEERELAFILSLSCQCCRTAALTMVLTWGLVGLEESQAEGWGRAYCRQRLRSFQNQDLLVGFAEEKMIAALLAKILSPSFSRQSCPNKENILRWSWAGRGRQPAMKNTTGAGVAW